MSDNQINKSLINFIPAKENRIFQTFFSWYSRLKMKKIFKGIYLESNYIPYSSRSTLYFGNHSMWWDALTPLMLNEFFLKQRPRAVMELEQIQKYSFFNKIGCFSINRSNSRSALESLAYGVEWLNKLGNSLYIYPEGILKNPSSDTGIRFENGIGWMIPKLSNHVDIVCITQHVHLMYDAKPSLFIRLSEPISRDRIPKEKKEATLYLEEITKSELLFLINSSSKQEIEMRKLF